MQLHFLFLQSKPFRSLYYISHLSSYYICINLVYPTLTLYYYRFGWRLARSVGLPGDCKKIKVDDCGVRFVKEDDDEKICFEDKDLSYNSM